MSVHKLILDDYVDDEQYALIAIHCTLDGYRLAYLLNDKLNLKLRRTAEDLDLSKDKSSFSVFNWEDDKQQIIWSLISNTHRKEIVQTANKELLFDKDEKITKTFNLIPEKKQVNFFLKIETEFNQNNEKKIIDYILSIPQISTAYSIDYSQLKSKDNLIFN